MTFACSSINHEQPDAPPPPTDGPSVPQPDAPSDGRSVDARPPDAPPTDAPGGENPPPVDPNLPPEPTIPTVCAGATLNATRTVMANGLPVYDHFNPGGLDTSAIQAAIDACSTSLTSGQLGSVKLQVNSANPAQVGFVSGPLFLKAGVTLWIDSGVTLFAAQSPRLYDIAAGTPTCGTDANNNSNGCKSLINVNGASATQLLADARVMGEGTIDGLGGEPMDGGFNGNAQGTWWDVAQHALVAGVSHSNPRLVDVLLADHFVLSHVKLHNSPKFHVGLESDNYIVWGITIQTPSRTVNSVGRKLTAKYARNTDGIDPSDSYNGVIAFSNISVGDDQIAFKCGKFHMNTSANTGTPSCRNLTVAHMHFGTGHGMSIGSETNGGPKNAPGIGVLGVRTPAGEIAQWGIHVYDLTIDGSLGTGGAPDVDINGIRVKSDVSRGGLVSDVLYENVCIRNLPNPLILNPHYDPTKTGILFPTYQNIVLRNIHAVGKQGAGTAPAATPIVTLLGLDQTHRTQATLDNVVVDGIAPANVVSQFADLALGPHPVNFTPVDNVSPPGSPSTVNVTALPPASADPVNCVFPDVFLDLGEGASPDNNASLSNLLLSADGTGVGLIPTVGPTGASVLTGTIPSGTQALSLTPTASAPRTQSIVVVQDGGSPVTVASGSATSLALPSPGSTTAINVIVTAEDGLTVQTTTLLVTRAAAAPDAALSGLTDSAAALVGFDPDQTSYTYAVPLALATNYTVTPIAHDPHATIKVNGSPVGSGSPSPTGLIDLSSGSATVVIVVTAEDGTTTRTYTLHITVTQAQVPVTGISLSAATLRLDNQIATSSRLIATLSPAGATDRAVIWSTDNPAVANVDDTGLVTAVTPGQAMITAMSHDGGFTASTSVFVFAIAFADDFEAPTGSGNWDLTPVAGGAFSLVTDGTQVLKYDVGTSGGVIGLIKDSVWAAHGAPTSYYVEARIKPQNNPSNTGNKQILLIARYQDSTHWYAAGLNMQTSSASTSVDIYSTTSGAPTRIGGQVKRPLLFDVWYRVRFELTTNPPPATGSTLRVYLDGELINTTTDTLFTAGKIGLFTANRAFEIDDVRVGDPLDRPVQFAISPNIDWTAEAGDAPRVITVNAQRPDYVAGTFVPDTFSVSSSDSTVVSATTSGNTVTLTPLKAGTATIAFSSGSTPSLTRSITGTIAPEFVQPTTVYPLTGRTSPVAGDTAAYNDARLTINFDTPPALGTASSARIFRASDDALVDVIKPGAEIDAIGFPGQSQVRVVNVEGLITASDKTVTIVPHHGKLSPGGSYYVAIGAGVITGTALGGTTWNGIGKAGGWMFTTRPAPTAPLTDPVVDDDGPADFRTVQGALDHAMQNATALGDAPVTIHVKNGTYPELLFLRGKNNVSIVGESRDGVVIQYKNYDSLNSGSGGSQAPGPGSPNGGRAVFLIETADLLTLDTLTLRNTMMRTPLATSQAETLYFNNDTGRLVAKHVSFFSEQDTLQLKGYSWFWETLVAGNVDFIWGNNRVALFEGSEIRSVGDSTSTTSGGYVVQARTVNPTDKGFVFLNSMLTHGLGPGGGDIPTGANAATYLARSPGGNASWDNVAYIKCKMDNHIIPIGWADNTNGQPPPNPPIATAVSGWREFGTTDLDGVPVDLSTRIGGDLLTPDDFNSRFSTRAQIFAAFAGPGGPGWNPQP
jgi:polygalacturonase